MYDHSVTTFLLIACDQITMKDMKSMKETHNKKSEAKEDHTARAMADMRQYVLIESLRSMCACAATQ